MGAAPISDEAENALEKRAFRLFCFTPTADRSCRVNGVARCSALGNVQSVSRLCENNCTCYDRNPCQHGPACGKSSEEAEVGEDAESKEGSNDDRDHKE